MSGISWMVGLWLAVPGDAPVAAGIWSMETSLGDRTIPAVMTLRVDDGSWSGSWQSQGRDMALRAITVDGATLRFERAMGPDQVLRFEGTIEGDDLTGTYTGPFGELDCSGRRGTLDPPHAAEEEGADAATRDDRPIYRRDGKTFVWARDDDGEGNLDLYDMTDAAIDPERLGHGVGRDTISSIDAPRFVAPDDPALRDAGIDRGTRVIGVNQNGVAKAYPLFTMSRHEIVNDEFGGEPFAVLW